MGYQIVKIRTEPQTLKKDFFGTFFTYNFQNLTRINCPDICRIPTSAEHREKWLKAIEPHQPTHQITTGFLICEQHFESADIIQRSNFSTCKSGSVPTIFSHEPIAKRKKMYVALY